MKNQLLALLMATVSSPSVFAGAGPGPWADGAYYPGQLDGRYFANVYNNLGGTFSRASTTNTLLTTNQVVTTTITNVGGIPTTTIITTNIVTSTEVTNTTITGSVVSGVISFGIRDGSAAYANAGTAAGGAEGIPGTTTSSSALDALSLDRSLNNFLVYVNGDVYVGTTSANINAKSSTVSGILANGAGRTRYQLFTNQEAGVAAVANTGIEVISIPSATANGYFGAKVKNNKSPYTFSGEGTISIATAVGAASEVDGSHDFQLNGIKTSGSSATAYPQTSAAANSQ